MPIPHFPAHRLITIPTDLSLMVLYATGDRNKWALWMDLLITLRQFVRYTWCINLKSSGL
jgi:hypothetical protein